MYSSSNKNNNNVFTIIISQGKWHPILFLSQLPSKQRTKKPASFITSPPAPYHDFLSTTLSPENMSSFDSLLSSASTMSDQPRWEVRACRTASGNSHYYVSLSVCLSVSNSLSLSFFFYFFNLIISRPRRRRRTALPCTTGGLMDGQRMPFRERGDQRAVRQQLAAPVAPHGLEAVRLRRVDRLPRTGPVTRMQDGVAHTDGHRQWPAVWPAASLLLGTEGTACAHRWSVQQNVITVRKRENLWLSHCNGY